MNKKFSTLVAVLLTAGAWTTLDAKVVEVAKPIAGSSYLVGAGINEDGSTEYTLLLGASGAAAKADSATVTAETPVWTLVSAGNGQYKLQTADDKVFYAVNGATSEAGGTDLTLSGDEIENSLPVQFTIESDGTLKLANVDAFGNNTDITGDLFLKIASNKCTLDVAGTVVDFGLYASSEGLPGFDLTVGDNGKVLLEVFDATKVYQAPTYFQTEDGYLFVELKDDAYVVKASKTAPTAAESINASWMWRNGKLVSVAVQKAEKPAYLKVANKLATRTAGSVVYSLDGSGSSFGVTGGALTTSDATNLTGAALYASAGVNRTIAPGITTFIQGGENIVPGSSKLANSVPSGYCVVALGSSGFLKAGATVTRAFSVYASDLDDYADYLWKVAKSEVNGQIYYSFTSLATDPATNKGYKWTLGGEEAFAANEAYVGQGITLSAGGSLIQTNATTAGTDPVAVIGLYDAFSLYKTKAELDRTLDPGFELTVKYEKDEDKTLENVSAFQVKMYPAGNADATVLELWNNPEFGGGKDAKKLVLDTKGTVGSDVIGDFKWLSEKEIQKGEPGQYKTNFQFQYAESAKDIITKLVVVGNGNVSILFNKDKYYLTTSSKSDAKLPYIKLGSDNIYSVKKLLGKLWNITYADSRANAKDDSEEYKLNGILAVTYDKDGEYYAYNKISKQWELYATTSVADYVASNTVAESAPEAQWLVTNANLTTNTFTLTNRENQDVKITGVQLRVRDNKFEVYITPDAGSGKVSTSETNLKGGSNDIVYVVESAKKSIFQGYMQTTENTLRSNNYNLGQYHAIGNNHNAYFKENHANSHKIGAIADAEEADKWKLHFAMKQDDNNKYTEVDTVFVVAKFATLNKDGDGFETDDKKIKKDTLAILPYTFQKVDNREFVAFNPLEKINQDFYICDPNNKDNSEGYYTQAARFALKVKPNGYNFIEIEENELTLDKVTLANSAENGSLERMQTYAADNNSIMVVEEADASEYHQIARVWGDTISLFRDENNSQVLYQKRDLKSVVENASVKDTLSFLNIDNINQFDVNPAIFVDTAYINRRDANNVLNTTYQYLLAIKPSFGYHVSTCSNPSHNPEISNQVDTVYGDFLLNLIDTANVYGINHIHSNLYTNDNEAGEKRAKLSFVKGFHTNDTLHITARQNGDTVKIGMSDPSFNVAKFAFRYVDSENKTFKIQTQFKNYLGDYGRYDNAEDFANAYDENPNWVSSEGYLKWINGTVVVEKGYENGDVFGIEENVKGNPVSNEAIETSSISVVATNGAVIIKGAQGKKVTISNVLGQTVASTVITSNEDTISAPVGVVIVAVEGEAAVKAIVK